MTGRHFPLGVMPAKAGIQAARPLWIPASAGMTHTREGAGR